MITAAGLLRAIDLPSQLGRKRARFDVRIAIR